MTYDNMLAFLEYLYTDRVPIQEVDPVSMLILSNEYVMPRLTSLCELYITEEVKRATSECVATADIDVIGMKTFPHLYPLNCYSFILLMFPSMPIFLSI